MMPVRDPAAFQEHFKNLNDPRVERTRKHPLINIVFIAVCGVLSGANSFAAIEEFGLDRRTWFARFLDLTNGVPSDDTFARVLARLDPGAFERCLLSWIRAVQEVTENRLIAIDGKTLRGSHDRGPGKAALHLVSAWATANHFTLGQVAVDGKSNEITAIPQLLDLLDLSGAIVTIDAMGCQKGIARQIREGGGHYVLAVKSNQERLLEDIQACFAAELDKADGEGNYSSHESVEQGHGRRESRHYLTIERPSGIRDEALWADLRTISMVVSERRVAGGAATSEVRYYIGSKPGKAKEYARYIRGHWGIENSLHWVLDMAFDEDRSRTRKDHGPENVALLRRLAVSILKNAKACHGSIRSKQLQAMLDDAVLEEMLRTFQAN